MGIKGLMVDFMDRGTKTMVEWQEQVLQWAVRGTSRTFNFMGRTNIAVSSGRIRTCSNREGVLNQEYLKWSDLAPPRRRIA